MRRPRAWFLAAVLGALAGCGDGSNSGDRVLVSKIQYESGIRQPQRYDVVVFKYPGKDGSGGPVENNTPKNYIKRLLGLPGEILAIFFGRLFRFAPPGGVPPYEDHKDPTIDLKVLRQKTREFGEDARDARKKFEEGRFEILRKPPDVMLALRRIVYDNNFPAKDMGAFPRWAPAQDSAWVADKQHGFTVPGAKAEQIDWLRYRHLVRPENGPAAGDLKPKLITDFMGYNGFETRRGARPPHQNWVGDLMLECQVEATKGEGELWLELSKGTHRFQARWDLGSGMCTLFKLNSQFEEGTLQVLKHTRVELDSKPTKLRGPGTYQVRFANIDARLTVWVDRDLPFGDGKDYPPPEVRHPTDDKDLDEVQLMRRRGPTENDLEPASIGASGAAVKVHNLRLWRDTYYSQSPGDTDFGLHGDDFRDPSKWGRFRQSDLFKTMYVQPGHYLCLGDNSQASADSRDWGLVPDRLMLGRALLVYYPFQRAGAIR